MLYHKMLLSGLIAHDRKFIVILLHSAKVVQCASAGSRPDVSHTNDTAPLLSYFKRKETWCYCPAVQ